MFETYIDALSSYEANYIKLRCGDFQILFV